MGGTNQGGWSSFSSLDSNLTPEQRKSMSDAMSRMPIASITIDMYGLDPGEVIIQYNIASDGALAGAMSRAPAVRVAGFRQFVEIVKREVESAFAPVMKQ